MSVDVGLEVFASLGEKLDREHDWRRRRENIVHQTPIVGQLAGSGTLDQGTQLAPIPGHIWSIRRLYMDSFTAGTVKVFINAMEPVALFATAGAQYFTRGAVLLQPKDRLVIVAAAITGSVNVWGVADEFPFWYLSEYLD